MPLCELQPQQKPRTQPQPAAEKLLRAAQVEGKVKNAANLTCKPFLSKKKKCLVSASSLAECVMPLILLPVAVARVGLLLFRAIREKEQRGTPGMCVGGEKIKRTKKAKGEM